MGKKKCVVKDNSSGTYLSSIKSNHYNNRQIINSFSKISPIYFNNLSDKLNNQQFNKDYVIRQGYNYQNNLYNLDFWIQNINFKGFIIQKLENNLIRIVLSDLKSENSFFYSLRFIFRKNIFNKYKNQFDLYPILTNYQNETSLFEIVCISVNPNICLLKYRDSYFKNQLIDQDLYLIINNNQLQLLNYDSLMYASFLRNDNEISKFKFN